MQTELHRHLDVSTRLNTLLELAQEQGLEAQSTSLEAFEKKIILRQPLSDLRPVLALFQLFQKVLVRPEILERIAFEAVEDCWNEGTQAIEFRYSPSFVSEFSSISWDDSLQYLQRGIKKAQSVYPKIKVGLICIASRDYGPDQAAQTVEFFLKNRKDLIGLDLAGNEDQFPCRLFESALKPAVQQNASITIHAGEAVGPENIWEAIEVLGAKRIGHGVTSIRDPELVRYLAEKRICLEMCPTSNWLTSAVPDISKHPLPLLLRAGVPVSINTDDPGVFGVTLPQEAQNCREKMGMSQAEVEKCWENASQSSFIPKV